MSVYGFDNRSDAADLLAMLRGQEDQPAPEKPLSSDRQYRPNAANARWFAKTPTGGIAAFSVGAGFDSGGGGTFTATVPTEKCKLYLVRMNVAGDAITIERWLLPDGTHAELLVGNLLTDPIDGDVLIGCNRAVGGALIADHGSC